MENERVFEYGVSGHETYCLMKHLRFTLLALTIICSIVISCHKSKHATTAATTPSLISGLTGMRFWTEGDSAGTYIGRDITWNFSGTNPIICTSATDTSYIGNEQVIFTGSNVTQINYYHNNQVYYPPLTINITYTAANLVDSITFLYPYAPLSNKKIAFQYNGSQITEAIQASMNIDADTFQWAAAHLYYFLYTGDNISQVIFSTFNGTSRDSQTYYYYTDVRKNNFGGSMATFLSLYIPIENLDLGDFLLEMPIYMNPNIVNENNSGSYIVTTDDSGRITERVFNSTPLNPIYYYY